MTSSAVSALVAEATKRSGVVWVDLDVEGSGGPRLVWHLWYDDALWLVCGGLEQEVPHAATATSALVTVRSKGTQNNQVVSWVADVSRVEPGTPAWDDVVPRLHEKRLNAPDGEAQPSRWASESLVLRLAPTGQER